MKHWVNLRSNKTRSLILLRNESACTCECDFLLAINNNLGPSCTASEIRGLKIENRLFVGLPTPVSFNALAPLTPFEFRDVWAYVVQISTKKLLSSGSPSDTIPNSAKCDGQTHRHADGQTDGHLCCSNYQRLHSLLAAALGRPKQVVEHVNKLVLWSWPDDGRSAVNGHTYPIGAALSLS